jgi:hypothetical protein
MSEIINNVTENFTIGLENLKEHKLVTFILVVLVSLYTTLYIKPLSRYTTNLFSNSYFKFILFILISYISASNPGLGVILAIAVLATLQTITYSNISNEINVNSSNKEQFSPIDVYQNQYLPSPLLTQSELPELGTNVNFQLETPSEYANNMIKKGKVLLDDTLELKNDIKKRYDVREADIAEITERDGNVLVQSGMNRLQPSNNGEYNDWIESDSNSNLSKNNNYNKLSNDKKASYIKYDKLLENYSDNEVIMDLLNLIKTKYNELTQNKSINQLDFDDKIEEIYDTEFDLLVTISQIKMKRMNKSDANKLEEQINRIKKLRLTNDKNYNLELNNLSELLCK